MAELTVTFRGAVYPWQLDHMGHFNVQFYVSMFDQSTWATLALVGLTAGYFREQRRGMAAIEQNIRYLHELYPGDLVENRSGFLEVRNKALRFFHEMRNVETGIVAARMEMVAVFMDTETRKSAPLPEAVRERALTLLVDDPAAAG